MKILLLVSSFNSLTQAVFVKLRDDGHRVSVTFGINENQIKLEVQEFEPELILATTFIFFITFSSCKTVSISSREDKSIPPIAEESWIESFNGDENLFLI